MHLNAAANPGRNNSEHLNFLEGSRALAALIVIFHHAWLQSWPANSFPLIKPHGIAALGTGWLAYGKLAVTAFIVISGFCLMLPVARRDKPVHFGNFMKRRAIRILPPYYAALVISFLLDRFLLLPYTISAYNNTFPLTKSGFIAHVFLLQNFTVNPFSIDGPLWSIAIEFQIYLLFPFLVWLYLRYGIGLAVGFAWILGTASDVVLSRAGYDNTFTHYLGMFGFGMAACHFAYKLNNKLSQVRRAAIFATVPIAIIAVGYHHRFGSEKLVTDTLVGLVVGIGLFAGATSPHGRVSRALSVKPLVWLGTITYSLYLIHNPLQQLIWQNLPQAILSSRLVTFLTVSTIGTTIIIAIAFGFFHIFERPCMQQSRKGRERVALAETPALAAEPTL